MRSQTVISFAAAMFAAVASAQAGAQPVVVPEPTFDEMPADATTPSIAVFAGGCFWGVQGVYQHVEGVLKAVSGYAGGAGETAHYELVGEGDTGHAESVQITYDPTRISYGKLLQIFFSVVHDPTQLNRQGPDHGLRSERSATCDRGEIHRPARSDENLSEENRDDARAGSVLSGRGVPPRFPSAESDLSVHRDQRCAEGARSRDAVPKHLPPGTRPGDAATGCAPWRLGVLSVSSYGRSL